VKLLHGDCKNVSNANQGAIHCLPWIAKKASLNHQQNISTFFMDGKILKGLEMMIKVLRITIGSKCNVCVFALGPLV
jgi:hypothetical protein